MTDKDIIKALECCKGADTDCWECELFDSCKLTVQEIMQNALDLINRQQATWIINPDGYYPYCSNCNYEPERPSIHNDNRTPYCPNCGAEMKKEGE